MSKNNIDDTTSNNSTSIRARIIVQNKQFEKTTLSFWESFNADFELKTCTINNISYVNESNKCNNIPFTIEFTDKGGVITQASDISLIGKELQPHAVYYT